MLLQVFRMGSSQIGLACENCRPGRPVRGGDRGGGFYPVEYGPSARGCASRAHDSGIPEKWTRERGTKPGSCHLLSLPAPEFRPI